jgi:hypothetical protein
MAIAMMKLYRALKAANVPDADAAAAAEEVAEFKESIAEIKSILRLHTWMLGLNTAGIAVLLAKVFH